MYRLLRLQTKRLVDTFPTMPDRELSVFEAAMKELIYQNMFY